MQIPTYLLSRNNIWYFNYRIRRFDTFLQTLEYPNDRLFTDLFKRFTYDELIQRGKLNLDIFWLKVDSLQDVDSFPPPHIIAAEIVENLQAALEQFTAVAEELESSEPLLPEE